MINRSQRLRPERIRAHLTTKGRLARLAALGGLLLALASPAGAQGQNIAFPAGVPGGWNAGTPSGSAWGGSGLAPYAGTAGGGVGWGSGPAWGMGGGGWGSPVSGGFTPDWGWGWGGGNNLMAMPILFNPAMNPNWVGAGDMGKNARMASSTVNALGFLGNTIRVHSAPEGSWRTPLIYPQFFVNIPP